MEDLLGGSADGGWENEAKVAGEGAERVAEVEGGEEEFVIRKRVKGEGEVDKVRDAERERRREERTKGAMAAGATFGPFGPTTGWP